MQFTWVSNGGSLIEVFDTGYGEFLCFISRDAICDRFLVR